MKAVDKSSLIEWFHSWRRSLSQDIYRLSGGSVYVEEVSRDVQRFLCKVIMSQMLTSRGILDTGCPTLDGVSSSLLSRVRKEISEIDLSEASFEVLSDIYESCLTRRLTLNSAGELGYSPEVRLRKGRGIYYTPSYIVRYIVDRTLRRYLWGTELHEPAHERTPRTLEDIRELRILDPACGSGCFLAYAFDVLSKFYAAHDPHAEMDWPSLILEEHLYGVDLDDDAVDLTSEILTLKALERSGYTSTEMPKPNVIARNFLISNPSASPALKPFDWKTEAPEVFNEGGFTMVLGNPPYGVRLTKAERRLIRSGYETHKGSNSSSLFVEKAVKILREGGFLGFIVPKSLSYVLSWRPIREFLLNNCGIIEIADTSKAFPGVRLEQMVVIAEKRDSPNARTIVSRLRPEQSTISHSIHNSALSSDRFSIWLSSERVKGIVDRIWGKSLPLGNVAEIWSGFNIKGLPALFDQPNAEHNRPCLRGRNIQRYHIRKGIQYVKVMEAVKRHRPPLEKFCQPKIVAQDIVAHIFKPKPHIKLTAAIDRSEYWINVNTVTNITSSQYPLDYLCGILNSRLISWYAYDFIYNRSIRTMHFRSGYASYIPIRRIDDEADPCFVRCFSMLMDRVQRITTLHGEGASKREIDDLDREIDDLVYQLYGITDEDLAFLSRRAGFYSAW